MNELGIFRSEFRDKQDVSGEIQTIIYLIKDELQNYIGKLISKNKNKDR